MSTRPSNSEFIEWVLNDENKLKVQNALRAHPDLINIKDSRDSLVSFNHLYFYFFIFTF